jgi:hypothetical protein
MAGGMGKNQSKSLSKGALIFAFNNEHMDYIAMAAWSAQNIQKHLNLPVAIVTDDPEKAAKYDFDHIITSKPDSGGTRYFVDYKQTVTWYNAGRATAYELSPFEQTLLLDADYVVASDTLLQVMEMPQQFVAFDRSLDPAEESEADPMLTKFGNPHMPMWWATVMMFRRGNLSQYIFDSMQMVRANWQHYRHLFNIVEGTYRNDYALSIALGILAGHEQSVHAIPWPMINVMPNQSLKKLAADQYQIDWTTTDNRSRSIMFGGVDFHAMGKKHLEKVIADN